MTSAPVPSPETGAQYSITNNSAVDVQVLPVATNLLSAQLPFGRLMPVQQLQRGSPVTGSTYTNWSQSSSPDYIGVVVYSSTAKPKDLPLAWILIDSITYTQVSEFSQRDNNLSFHGQQDGTLTFKYVQGGAVVWLKENWKWLLAVIIVGFLVLVIVIGLVAYYAKHGRGDATQEAAKSLTQRVSAEIGQAQADLSARALLYQSGQR